MIRVIDILLALVGLVLLLPLLVIIALSLKFTGEGEIFFLQERTGREGKLFNVFKFATMLKNSPNIGPGTVTVINDPRVLPVGHILRKTKINELPQLLNILFGTMSFIGPRPLTKENFSFYSDDVKENIVKCRPGLSGVGSIIFRNEEFILKNSSDAKYVYKNFIAPYKGELEVWFYKNKNIYLYFKLIILTIAVVVYPKSAILLTRMKNFPQAGSELSQLLEDQHPSV